MQVPTRRVVATVRCRTGCEWKFRSRRERRKCSGRSERATSSHDDIDNGHVRERLQRLRALRLRTLVEAAPTRGRLQQQVQRELPRRHPDGPRLPTIGGGQYPTEAQGGGTQEAGLRSGRHQRGSTGAERSVSYGEADGDVERSAADDRPDDDRHAGRDADGRACACRRADGARRTRAVQSDGDVAAAHQQRRSGRARIPARIAVADERRDGSVGCRDGPAEPHQPGPRVDGHGDDGATRRHRRCVARTAAGWADADVPVEQRCYDSTRLLSDHVAHTAAQQLPGIACAVHCG